MTSSEFLKRMWAELCDKNSDQKCSFRGIYHLPVIIIFNFLACYAVVKNLDFICHPWYSFMGSYRNGQNWMEKKGRWKNITWFSIFKWFQPRHCWQISSNWRSDRIRSVKNGSKWIKLDHIWFLTSQTDNSFRLFKHQVATKSHFFMRFSFIYLLIIICFHCYNKAQFLLLSLLWNAYARTYFLFISLSYPPKGKLFFSSYPYLHKLHCPDSQHWNY